MKKEKLELEMKSEILLLNPKIFKDESDFHKLLPIITKESHKLMKKERNLLYLEFNAGKNENNELGIYNLEYAVNNYENIKYIKGKKLKNVFKGKEYLLAS